MLTNIDILPNTLVSPIIRLDCYEKAIDIIKNNKIIHGFGPDFDDNADEYSLCILLPSVLWNLNHYNDNAPNNNYWHYKHTSNMFIEITEKVIQSIEDENKQFKKSFVKVNNYRIKCLEKAIEEVKLLL